MGQKCPTCPSCSRKLSPWGKSSSGMKRYGCNYCGKTRIYKKKVSKRDPFDLFRQYILWGLTYEVLSSQSGYSTRYLEGRFHQYLSQKPPPLLAIDQSSEEETYLLIDGLWFGRWFVLMVYRQSKNLTILHISVMGREVSTKIAKDLLAVSKKYVFTGIISDGATGIKKAVQDIFGNIPHQICLAHLHRQAVNALGRFPKDDRTRTLKALADHLWLIESKEALKWWTKELKSWIHINFNFLREFRRDDTGRWWYVHKGVRKAARILLTAPEGSFTFLDHPTMPKTTNEIEAQFGHLGKRWLAHRGLKRERWKPFLNWFVYFYNQDKLSSRKQKAV